MLLEVADTLLDQLLLVVKQTELEGGVSLRLCFIFGLSYIHQFSQMVNGHLHVAVLGMDISQQFMSLTFLVTRARLELTLANF